jgi:biotin synthase-related radical SAM superfamily protein
LLVGIDTVDEQRRLKEFMTRDCPICDMPFRDGDDVVAIMVSKFKLIDSDASFAIEHPTRCIELVHSECFDWDEYGDEKESA